MSDSNIRPLKIKTIKQMEDNLMKDLDQCYAQLRALHHNASTGGWTSEVQYIERVNKVTQFLSAANKRIAAFQKLKIQYVLFRE